MKQAAAVPFRRIDGVGAIEVLLVESSSGRWIVPKGDIDDGMQPHLAAEKEAFEEGGVRGRIDEEPLGQFHSRKEQDGAVIEVEVVVFPLEVRQQLDHWPEEHRRKRQWLPVVQAAEAVAEPELAAILRRFVE